MKSHKDLTSSQIGAIKKGINLGRILQLDHPEIKELYEDKYMQEIVKELDIESGYDVNTNIARTGVLHAISGHDGSFGIKSYEGLIIPIERRRIRKEHLIKEGNESKEKNLGIHNRSYDQRREDGKKGGNKAYKDEIGIHLRSIEQKREDSYKGGIRSYNKRKGIHKRTNEQKREDNRKAIIARNQIPWSVKETELAYLLRQKNNDYRSIASILNNRFHKGDEVRTISKVKNRIIRHRKSLESKVNQ
ncbi:hypothetical protein GOV12_02395 [Candidatus Pacearchaeota archaeon]|nr:hypothetical protein [Candidatus Pacearchaeota archaeon]